MEKREGVKMKSHIIFEPSKAQRKEINKFVADEVAKQEAVYMRRIFKVICYVLYNDFGFGVKKLAKVINSANEAMADMTSNEVIWDRIDRKLRDIGLEFENEDYEEREARAKQLRQEKRWKR